MSFIMTKPNISFSVVLLTTAILISSSTAHSTPFCNSKVVDDKTLCTQMAKGATTWTKVMTNALTTALQKTHAAKPIVDAVASKLPASLLPQTKESIEDTCRKTYEDVVYNLERCIEFMKTKDYSSLLSYISAISFEECPEGASEFEVELPEAGEVNVEVKKLVTILLAVAAKKP